MLYFEGIVRAGATMLAVCGILSSISALLAPVRDRGGAD